MRLYMSKNREHDTSSNHSDQLSELEAFCCYLPLVKLGRLLMLDKEFRQSRFFFLSFVVCSRGTGSLCLTALSDPYTR